MKDTRNKCEFCGWIGGVEKHHIIKRIDYGSDNPENIIDLCRNHHWILHRGREDESKVLEDFIKKAKRKGEKLSQDKIEKIDNQILRNLKFYDVYKNMTDEEILKNHKGDWLWHTIKKDILRLTWR